MMQLGTAVIRAAENILDEWRKILDEEPNMPPAQRERMGSQVERLERAIDGLQSL